MVLKGSGAFGCNTNVVHIDADCGTARLVVEDDITKDGIHHCLKHGRRVGEAKNITIGSKRHSMF